MQTQWAFRDCRDDLKPRMRAYWADKLPRLERLLQRFPDALREISLAVEKVHSPERFHTKAAIHLPTNTLVAEELADSWQESFDKVADELSRRIKRHKEKLRRDWAYRRKGRRKGDLEAASKRLAGRPIGLQQKEFFESLRPLTHVLADHAGRELSRLAREGVIHHGELSVSDLTDEVLVRAWQRCDGQPLPGRLDIWLMRLLDEIVLEVASNPAAISLDSTPAPDQAVSEAMDDEEETDRYADFFHEHALTTLADVLPDEHAEAWEALDMSEQRARIEEALAQLAAEARLAFIHHAVEGFDASEIAMMQDRPEDEVIADIEAAENELRRAILGMENTSHERRRSSPFPR